MKAKLRNSDAILGLFVLATVLMLMVPLPTAALDILLALNLSVSVLLLLVGLYMSNVLAMLAFPSLLLLTTLFRLGLNVASTRLILSQGDAGKVIEAFGTFLIRGEVAVGIIIFVIITVVNLIVISRGASRVSEVAARFTLESIPGKQMAIDSDLRSGLISPQIAQRKREDLRKESQLYGSMDGAMKFVQGDAVAGVFIIFTNIIGGIYQGIKAGMSFPDAVDTYTILTVGDGLVSQIPALLISICAGIVVTRVSSDEDSTLGADLVSQLFRSPALLLISSSVVLMIGLLPGIPFIPFLVIGMLFAAGAVLVKRHIPLAIVGGTAGLPMIREIRAISHNQQIPEYQRDSFISLQLDTSLFKLYSQDVNSYNNFFNEFFSDLYQELGILIPTPVITQNSDFERGSYRIECRGRLHELGKISVASMMLDTSLMNLPALGMIPVESGVNPLSAACYVLVPRTNANKKIAQAGGLTAYDPIQILAVYIAGIFVKNPEEIISLTHVHTWFRDLGQEYPGLLEDASYGQFLTASRIAEVLQELLRQRVSIKDLRSIIESLAAYCSAFRSTLVSQDEFDLHDIVSFVRLHRKRDLPLASQQESIRYISIADEVEEIFSEATYDRITKSIELSIEDASKLKASLAAIIDPIRQRGLYPVVFICASTIRHKILSFMNSVGQPLILLSTEELLPGTKLEQVAEWSN